MAKKNKKHRCYFQALGIIISLSPEKVLEICDDCLQVRIGNRVISLEKFCKLLLKWTSPMNIKKHHQITLFGEGIRFFRKLLLMRAISTERKNEKNL